MYFQVVIYVSMILISVHGKELDPGPQVFPATNYTTSPQSSQKRFATKDVIVYLTPSQIKDLEAGKAELRATSVDQITINKLLNYQQTPQESYHLENLNILKTPLIPNPNLRINYKLQDLESHTQLPEKQSEGLSKSNFFQQQQQVNQNDRQISEKWTPVIPTYEKNQEMRPSQEQFNKKWQKVLQKNREQLKLISDYQRGLSQEESSPDLEAQNFNELKNAINRDNVKIHEIDQLEPRVEAARFDLPVIIHKEVKITKHHPIVKHVNVPVPTPVLVPYPEPYEVKVPHPYPVQFQIMKHVPVQLKAETEKTHDNQRNPVGTVFINVNSPYLHAWKN